MSKTNKQSLLGRTSLFAATLIWGTSFVVLKNTIDSVPLLWVLAFRFVGASFVFLICAVRELKKLDRKCLKMGALMGFLLFLAYTIQTYGLMYTTPGKNAFLTSVYCILVPFLNWYYTRRKPDRFNISAGLLAIVGVGLVSITGDLTVGLGDSLTIICGIFYALQIIAADRALDHSDVILLVLVQSAVCGALCLAAALIVSPFPASLSPDTMASLIYLCLLSTAGTEILQIYGQKHTQPSPAAIIMSLESVVGVTASLLFYPDEVMTFRIGFGFALIFFAVIVSETKLSFLKLKR